MTVIGWDDPETARVPGAMATDSDTALTHWTPVLGPAAMLMARRFAQDARRTGGPVVWQLSDLAAVLGLGTGLKSTRNSLDRLERFGVARQHESELWVRLMLAPPRRWSLRSGG